MKDAMVSIAAGAAQLPLLRAARRLGFAVLAADRDVYAPGFALADACVVKSSHDADGILCDLDLIGARFRVRAVATKSSGIPVATAARVARALGLRGLEPELAVQAVTKPGLLELAQCAGVPVPRHRACGTIEEARRAGIDFPLVVKPSLTVVGKRGVVLVQSAAELALSFEAARAASGDGRVEVEEFVEGRDLVLVGLFEESRWRSVAALDEDTRFDGPDSPRSSPPMREARGFGLALADLASASPALRAAESQARKLVEGLHFGTGVAFLTFRVRGREALALIEAHFDLAGDFVADRLFGAAASLDLIDATLRILSGEPLAPLSRQARPAELRFLFASDLAEDGSRKLERLRALGPAVEVDERIPASGEGAARRVGLVLLKGGARENRRLVGEVDRILGRVLAS